jgi:tetratricopeptide (TPR) repeat protein
MDLRHLRRSTGVTPTSAGRITLDRRDFALGAAVALLAALVFAPSLRGKFTGYDDTLYTTLNPHMTAPDGLARIWLSDESPQYYPLTFTTYWLAAHLFGDTATSYHAINLAFHAMNAGLAFLLIRSLGLMRGSALFAAALFAVHPVQVMSVAWIAGLKNMLSTFFCLTCLMSWHQFRAKQSEPLYAVALLCFAVALLSKSAILLLPLTLLAIDRLIFALPWRSSIFRILPMLVLGALSVAATSGFEKPFILRAPDLAQRPLIAAAGYFFYIYKLLWPAHLAPFYPLWKVSTQSIAWWIPVAGFLAITAIIWRTRRKQRGLIAIAAIIFFAMILPASGILVFGNLAWTYVSDHYLYFACLGPFILAAIAAQTLASRSAAAKNATLAIASILVIACAAQSIRYTPVFHEGESLWTHTLKSNPDCLPARAGLGQLYAARKKWPQAIEQFQIARKILPEEMDLALSLGEAQSGAGDYAGADRALREVLARQPQRTAAILQLGVVAEKTGRYADARQHYRQCLEINPNDAQPHFRLGRLCLGLMERDEASVHFRMVNRLDPREPWGYGGLAACWRGLARYADAIAVLRQGVAALPGDMGMLDALARLLATAPDDKVRNGREALELATKACDGTKRNEPDLLDTLAAAYAELGRFDEALATANQAAQLADQRGDAPSANKLRLRADQYAKRMPLREAPMQRRQ